MTTETTTMRRCIGSIRFDIEAHNAPADDFPVQPSQKDGLGRMCKPHWRAYTNALRNATVARKAEDATEAGVEAGPEPTAESPAEVAAPPAVGTRPRPRLARPPVEPESTATEPDAA